MLGVCLAAVFGVCAVASASAMASARPEFKSCIVAKKNSVTKKYEGEFDGSLCSSTPTKKEEESAAKTGKKYDLVEATTGTKFTGTSGGTTLTADGLAVKCKHDTVAGEITSQFEDSEKITFTECSAKVGATTVPCGTAGTIETAQLAAELFFLDETETQAAFVFSGGGGGVFAEFNCGATAVVVEGFVVGKAENSTKGATANFALTATKPPQQALKTIWESGTLGPVSLESGGKEATLKTKETQGPTTVHVYL
jgi:hypothetical protein